jgi:hypothetical protein
MHVAPFRLALSKVQFDRVCCGFRYYGEVMKIMLVSHGRKGQDHVRRFSKSALDLSRTSLSTTARDTQVSMTEIRALFDHFPAISYYAMVKIV